MPETVFHREYTTPGKPQITGSIYRGTAGATLPTSVSAELEGFTHQGYVSEDGVTFSTSHNSNQIKAWGGDIVYASASKDGESCKFKLLESMNEAVNKTVYGDSNVSGTIATGMIVSSAAGSQEAFPWVIDQVLTGGVLKRTVIPAGTISGLGDIVYKDSDLAAYDITLSLATDNSGHFHYDYYGKPSQS